MIWAAYMMEIIAGLPSTCCSGRWMNTTYSLNTAHSDGTVTERKRDAKCESALRRHGMHHFQSRM